MFSDNIRRLRYTKVSTLKRCETHDLRVRTHIKTFLVGIYNHIAIEDRHELVE